MTSCSQFKKGDGSTLKGAAACEFQLIFVGSPWLAFRTLPSPSWDTSPFFAREHVERAAWQVTAQGIGPGFLGWAPQAAFRAHAAEWNPGG